ncbi:MAG: glycosyltransferase family 4 protein [Candidatus Thorarchaeota archaeon]
MFKTKKPNLLVISHAYNNFQKDPIDIISNYSNNVSVLARSNPIAEISKYISIPFLDRFKLDYRIDLTNKPSNLNVHPTPILYGPTDTQYKKLGEKHVKAVEKAIIKNNIKFDLIHSHFSWSSGYAGAKLAEKHDVPFVVTAHGYDIYDLPFRDKEWKTKIEYVLNSADYILTVSEKNSELINELNVKTPVKVLPNGYRNDLFHPKDAKECRKILNLPIDKKIILTVGNLEVVKGHQYLIDSMSEIIKHRQDVMCIIVGDGKLMNKLKNQINKAGLKNYVQLTGARPHDEIPIWINACDAFVLPSLNEGNPTVMFETLGCGKPFIGTNVGGIPEIITSEDYGLLCKPTNSKELAENILGSFDKDWDYEKIREYGEQFTWNNTVNEILTVYSEIL